MGSYLALFLEEEGAKVIALSDSAGGIHNPNGIDVKAAQAHKQETGALAGLRDTESITNEELVLLDCDVLAPCALEQVITADNADKVKAQIIVEGANGPVTPSADEILEDRGVLVLPDVLANAGGVVVSYFEWVQGLQEYFWKETEVNARLNDITTRAFNETWRVHEQSGVSMRMAAYGLAVQRVAEATTTQRPLPVTRVTLFAAAGCHLCERARAVLEDVQRRASVRARGGRHRRRPRPRAALPRVAAGRRDRRRARLHLPRPSGGARPPPGGSHKLRRKTVVRDTFHPFSNAAGRMRLCRYKLPLRARPTTA